MPTLLSTAQPTPNSPAPNAPVLMNSFSRGSRLHVEPFMDTSVVVSAASTGVGPVDIPAYGFLRHVVLLVQATGGTGAAAVAREDAPWSAIRDITLSDVNGNPIVGPIGGYDLYLINAFGGYANDSDPALSPTFSAVAATGNFSFLLRIPCELTVRDGLGALGNGSAASTFKLIMNVAPATEIYSTNPTGFPSVRIRGWQETWMLPPATDLMGIANAQLPPAFGTTQMWTGASYNVNAGDQRVTLKRVGGLVRNLIFVQRNITPVRSTTDFPDGLRVEMDGRTLHNIGRDLFRHYMREQFRITAPTGVFVFQFTIDDALVPGDEARDQYLPTTQATRLELVGNWGNAGTLRVLTNDVAPAGMIPKGD